MSVLLFQFPEWIVVRLCRPYYHAAFMVHVLAPVCCEHYHCFPARPREYAVSFPFRFRLGSSRRLPITWMWSRQSAK